MARLSFEYSLCVQIVDYGVSKGIHSEERSAPDTSEKQHYTYTVKCALMDCRCHDIFSAGGI